MTAAALRFQTGNLPVEVTSFVGRKRELADALQLLVEARLLTMTGVGGVGKTRLALRLAAESRDAFPDGVWLVDLAELDQPEFVVDQVAAMFGVHGSPDTEQIAALRDFLAGKNLLLLLDNCEHLLDACAVLVTRLLSGSAGLRVLCTSRQPLGMPGEYVFAVPPLDVPAVARHALAGVRGGYDAVELFAARAAATVPGFAITEHNVESVVRLCQQLDGIPLAIELATARLRAFSVDQILARLDDRYRLLTAGNRIALPRQRTLRAMVDWSFGLCSPAECLLWTRLSVFAGGFDLASAETICCGDGVPADDMFDILAGLVEKSLVIRGEIGGIVRYRLTETIRQYGRDRLIEAGAEDTMRRRHRDWFERLAQHAEAGWLGTDQAALAERVEMEKANLRSALDFCLADSDDGQRALALAATLCSHRRACGSLSEGRRWLERVLVKAPEPTPARATALWTGAWLVLMQGDHEAGMAMLDECRLLAERLGDASAAAKAIQFTGLAELFQARFDNAIELLSEALARHRELGDANAAVLTFGQLTMARCFAGAPEAGADVELCLAKTGKDASPASRAFALWFQSVFRLGRRDFCGGTDAGVAALRLWPSTPTDGWLVSLCLETLAWCAAGQGQFERAARLLGAAEATRRSIGSMLAGLRHLADRHEECRRRSRQALGESAFLAAWRAGAELSLPDAVDYATNPTPVLAQRTAPDDPLTPREREIAGLVARGLSNREIAAELVIAQRTAETHVEHILSKLGFNRRSQIAAWSAGRHG